MEGLYNATRGRREGRSIIYSAIFQALSDLVAVTQTLVELLSELAYVRMIPRLGRARDAAEDGLPVA